MYVAVELIGLWAVLVGALELIFASNSSEDAKNRALPVFAALASIVIGVDVMKWAFAGAVLVSAVIGVAAAALGVSLIMSGIRERISFGENPERASRHDAA